METILVKMRDDKLRTRLKRLLILLILLIIYIYIANITLMPDSIILMQGEKINLACMLGVSLKEEQTSNPNIGEYTSGKIIEASNGTEEDESKKIGKIDLSVNLLNNIKLKDITINVIPNTKVIPLGNAIGLKLYTEGVLIVGKSEIEGNKPYENTGIEEGDRIISINDKKISSTDELIETVNKSQGKELIVKYVSEDKEKQTTIIPAKTRDNEYKLGLWVRDAAAGVGTATFYIPSTGTFSTLGHGITDIDTGDLVTIETGELVTSNIISIQKGIKGKPGEIRGSIENGKKIGSVSKNTMFGIFGNISNKANLNITESETEIASRDEIKVGKAQIICELETGNKKYYDIEIQKIYINNNSDNKSMLIKIVDNELIEKTGGIIQGMSGSPIMQNGKLVGAITNVLINDPTTGYGVFADMMLKQMSET